jgi:cysteinyl-tRNA synthetase
MVRGLLLVTCALICCLPAVGADPRADLSWVESWAVWLQAPDIDTLEASTYDFVVIDYSYDGSESGEFSYDDIQQIRDSGKLVLAYLSVAEAEDYRFYWKSSWRTGSPAFIGDENPNWPGNYNVKYWSSGWWNKVVEPYLDRILAAGFDGVFLDRVDAYWWWYEVKGIGARRCANRMAQLVEKVANYTRTAAGEGFIVCPNGGVSLLDDTSSKWRGRYLAAVDATSTESLFFGYWSTADRDYRLEKLAEFNDAGRKAFVIDYIGPDDWDSFFQQIADSGLDLVGYPAAPDMELDELVDLDAG